MVDTLRRVTLAATLALCLAGAVAASHAGAPSAGGPLVRAVDSAGMTVADMDRSVAFFTRVLGFEPVSDVEVAGPAYEDLEGVFGLRMRVVRLRLGEGVLRLTG